MLTVAVLGATGAVGEEMVKILMERNFPVKKLIPMASERSLGRTVEFHGETIPVEVARPELFKGVDLVLASPGARVSRELLPRAVEYGAVCIDNSSAFRMEPDVPLVVPEVNPHRIPEYRNRGIIANPNCSTIQLVVVLNPILKEAGIRRVHVSTYQSVSGAGRRAMDELFESTRAIYTQEEYEPQHFPLPIAFNLIPQVDVFLEDGFTKEEWKMRNESNKILETDINLSATCVRVPVFYGHSEAVWVETETPLSPEEVREILKGVPSVVLMDENRPGGYPTPREIAGTDPVYVGRIRKDPTSPTGIILWIVADNIRKGAALNAIQIAEHLLSLGVFEENRR
jgi:aspartate-semialdehyde dehydrogenase